MNYRYHTGRALRVQGQPFNQFDGVELKSEDFDSYDEFIEKAIECELEHIYDTEEGQDD